MIDLDKRRQKEQEKERQRRRMKGRLDPDNYEYIPAKKPIDFYDNDVNQRVGIYARVSTDDVRQTTSYELQKKYYEDFVVRHPNWTLVKIYADEGISGTSLRKRDEFNQMIADCRAGKIDIIITKSISRFARNVMICIGMVRELAELKPPVGVFFESECIFSLNDESQMALTFQAAMAEEESHIRSRSMETSLRMRLDNGIPLTPKLLGYTHDMDGNLVVNQDEAPTVKLAFYMYLYGYSTQQIADCFIALGRRSYLGNIKWTSGSIVQILRNERHCGDVLTRKTFTPDFHTHLSKKNRGERPQSRYYNHHEAIISRDDFIAVQKLLDNSKYGNKSVLPELRVIDSGILRGYVSVNPRWAGFKTTDYYRASQSAYPDSEDSEIEVQEQGEVFHFNVEEGDFDLRGFEVARSELFDARNRPMVVFSAQGIRFNATCVKKFGAKNRVELLINPIERKFAVRPADKTNRNGVVISKPENGVFHSRIIPSSAFGDKLYEVFGWNIDCKYRIIGSLYEKDSELAFIFDAANSEAFFKSYILPAKEIAPEGESSVQPLMSSGKRIRAIPEEWVKGFGDPFYMQERSMSALESQSEEDWKLYLKGRLVESGKPITVTGFDELQSYIKQELRSITPQEVRHE